MQRDITKKAAEPTTHRRPAYFYRSAREGMVDLLKAVLDEGRSVLLPGYIGWSPIEGSGVFDPVLEADVPYAFYDLHQDLTVDLDAFRQVISSGSVGVAVVIHYFGRSEPHWREIRALADAHGVFLVEDLAHGWFSALGSGPSGSYGDAQLYSMHKMLPFADGGMVTYGSPSHITTQESTAPELAAEILSYDADAIASHRRSVFVETTRALVEAGLTDDRFEIMWPELGPDVPQTLPVRILRGNRDAIYRSMNADGVGMVSLYHTLIGQLPKGFEGIRATSRQIINFPVHQDVPAGSAPRIVETFLRALDAAQDEASSPDADPMALQATTERPS